MLLVGGDYVNAIRNRREKAGLSQENIAKGLSVSQQAVAKWENGKALPRADKLPELARILNCTIDELLATDKAV